MFSLIFSLVTMYNAGQFNFILLHGYLGNRGDGKYPGRTHKLVILITKFCECVLISDTMRQIMCSVENMEENETVSLQHAGRLRVQKCILKAGGSKMKPLFHGLFTAFFPFTSLYFRLHSYCVPGWSFPTDGVLAHIPPLAFTTFAWFRPLIAVYWQ